MRRRLAHLVLRLGATVLAGAGIPAAGHAQPAGGDSSAGLRIVIIRHAEKPPAGDNLSCQGLNRALALPAVLMTQFGRPDFAYVPAMKLGKSSTHARMFQTLTPFAVRQNLTINSRFAEDDVSGVAQDVLQRKGLVLLVWEHSQIQALAAALGVAHPPKWSGDDFDSIWIVQAAGARTTLATSSENLSPSPDCGS